MKKTNFVITLLSAATVIVMTSALFLPSGNSIFPTVRASTLSYGINFNSNKNKFHSYTDRNTAYSGDVAIKTDLGNDIGFTYSNLLGNANTWHILAEADGYFYNTSPIHGMSEISLSFKTGDLSYKLYWSNDLNFDDDRSATFTSSDSTDTISDFNSYYPTYFKVENTSGAKLNISAISISLTCENNYPNLDVSSENNTMGTVSGTSGVIRSGTNVTIVATPNSGYRFVGWYSGETLISSNANYSFVMGNDDLSYVAKFAYGTNNFIVQSESNSKGTVSNSSGSYDYLSSITIEATPNNGYSFQGWYSGQNLVSTSNPYTFAMPYQNTTYTAKFSANSYELTLVNDNGDLGSISGEGTYAYGSVVTITATPNTGVSFLGWYDESDTLIASSLSYSFNMPYENVEYTAKFAYTPYTINISVNDDTMGSVSGDGSYIYNQQVNLVATPNVHYSFFGWYNGDELLSQEATLTFNMPNSSLNYTARFVRNYSLLVYSDNSLMGDVSYPALEWGAGLEVTVNALPNTGYAFNRWEDFDYNIKSYDSSYTFTMPEEDVKLYAVFANGYILNVTSSDITKGTVTGGGTYIAGRSVTVTMDYISGTFKGWYDSGNNLVSTSNPYTFVMPSNNYSLEAIFMTQAEEEEAWNIAHGATPVYDSSTQTITYGLYPQTNVNDSTLLTALNALTIPESNGWYLYNDEYYAKLSATPYSSSYVFDNGTTIVSGTTYWFKCEPIVWNVLSNNSGEYYILSSVLLDAHCYYNSTSSRTIDGKTVYANNYEYSDIRTWLNDDFYNSAFALGNSYIQTTTVDNSASTTNSSSNSYACSNTQDKVFLPSYQDYINSSYGFTSNASRYCKTTDWARARGAWYSTSSSYLYNGFYWTRSPLSDRSNFAWYVDDDGGLDIYYVRGTDRSVRPSLSINIA